MDARKSTPLVSVIMPAYNAAGFIAEAVRSVQKQTLSDWELLILDDGSADATPRILADLAAQDPRIRLLPNSKNLGAAATRNRGIDLAQGQYLAFLDSDDRWHPEKLQTQLQLLEKTGGDLCYCAYAIVGTQGASVRPDYAVPETVDFDRLLRENVIGCSTVLLRCAALGQLRFTTDFYHEDYVLWLQLLRSGCKAVGCTQVLADWRLLEDSRSFHKGRSARNRWIIYRKCLGLPLWKSAFVFACYAAASLKKYGAAARR